MNVEGYANLPVYEMVSYLTCGRWLTSASRQKTTALCASHGKELTMALCAGSNSPEDRESVEKLHFWMCSWDFTGESVFCGYHVESDSSCA
jgi:hypothetical protein